MLCSCGSVAAIARHIAASLFFNCKITTSREGGPRVHLQMDHTVKVDPERGNRTSGLSDLLKIESPYFIVGEKDR